MNNYEDKQRFDSLIGRIDAMPVSPHIAEDLMNLRGDLEATTAKLEELIHIDPSLYAQVIKAGNDVFPSDRIKSAKDAMFLVLDYESIMDIAVEAISKNKEIHEMPLGGPIGFNYVWQHSVYLAIAFFRIGRLLKERKAKWFKSSPDELYALGMLHDIGYLIQASLFPDIYEDLNNDLMEGSDPSKIYKSEEKYFGFNHGEIGCELLFLWGLDRKFCDVIKYHHTPEKLDSELRFYAVILCVLETMLFEANNPNSHTVDYETISESLRGSKIEVEELREIVLTILNSPGSLETVFRELTK